MHPRRLTFPLLCSLSKHRTPFPFLQHHPSQRTLTTQPASPLPYLIPELRNYTSGRWLVDDLLHQKSRVLSFNYENLCTLVLSASPGAKGITAAEKKEGNNARILIFSLDTDEKVVAKLPFSIAGPRGLSTGSEVATMAYSKSSLFLLS
jgi:hypothetical protein